MEELINNIDKATQSLRSTYPQMIEETTNGVLLTKHSSSALNSVSTPPSKTKVKRHRPSWQERILLEQVFEKNPYPDLSVRTQLASQLGITPRKVQIWFQNRRTKEKNAEQEIQRVPTNPQPSPPIEDTLTTIAESQGGNSIIMLAAACGDPLILQLLGKGVNINITNEEGWTPLYAAVTNKQEATVSQILTRSQACNVNTKEKRNQQSPLHVAALKGYDSISWLLLTKSQSISVNIRDKENRTPLHHACIRGFMPIVKQLLQHKADISAATLEGHTPLQSAALMGHLDIVQLLLENGAQVNQADVFGFSPLTFAVREQHEDIVKFLLANGANVNSPTIERLTPLHLACCRRNFNILQMVFEKGANLWAMSVHGYTPIKLAELHHNEQFIRFLYDKMVFTK